MTQRQEIIERLRAVDLGGGGHESLSAIAKAVYEPAGGWTIVACEVLRQTLVRLLGGDTAQGGCVTNELPDLLRKASEGSYEGSKGDVIGNIAQLIGCKSRITFAVIDALADKVEQALSEAYEVGHIDGFDEAERWHTEQCDWLGKNTHITPSDGGRITDELRGLAEDPLLGYASQETHKEIIIAIADRIDAEHERALSHAYMDVNDSMWFRLPKDIDNKPIVERGKVDWRDHAGTWHENVTVVAVCHDGCYVMDGTVFCVHKSDIRHHHASTVEEVLREFADEVQRCCDTADTIAEYAKRLKLAGSDAE